MGVTHLWPILEPVREHIPLSSLQGKTLAVDLSLWVCEAQTVKKMKGIVTKPHLRNLYFRVSSLTLMGVHLVFVLEGEPPRLKANTMEKRTEVRFGPSKKPGTSRMRRPRLKSLLRECREMLECLGVPWVQAAGEAEAMCAYLDAHGYVDGCITNDGDAFLYGAQTVYRNFTMNVKDPHVDCYLMTDIEKKLGCSRQSLIGLAVLLGCDYLPKGVPGIGKEQALKLIRTLKGQNLLQRFECWKDHFQSCDAPSIEIEKVTHCEVCHHPGSYKGHEHIGCQLCGSVGYCEPHDCPCDWHSFKQHQQTSAVEESIRKKAQMCEGFPFSEVIQEYLVIKDKPVKLSESQRPNLLSFQRFAFEKMEWTKHYACEKLCTLLTFYDMNRRKSGHKDPRQLQALRIVKSRTRNGIPCFEIEWQKPEHYVPEDDQPAEPFIITIEESSLFQAAYPEVVAMYHLEKMQVCKERKHGKKSRLKETEGSAEASEVADLLSRLNMKSTCQAVPSKDAKSNFHVFPGKDSECQLLSVTERCSSMVSLSQNRPFTSPIITFENKEENCNLAGSWSSQVHFTKSPAASSSDSAIADLQLSGIDWDGTSFSVSPKLVPCNSEPESGTCSNTTRSHSLLCQKTAEPAMPSSDAVQYDPNLSFSVNDSVLSINVNDSVSDMDPPKGQNDLSLKEKAILKPAVLEALSKSANVFLLRGVQRFEQIKGTFSSGEECLSSSTQLNDRAQKIESTELSGKYPRGHILGHDKKSLQSSEHTTWVMPTVLKSSLKSVCQHGYLSEDSDSEVKTEMRKAHKVPKWQRKFEFVQPGGKYSNKGHDNEPVLETQQTGKESACKSFSKDLPVNHHSNIYVPNPLRLTKRECCGPCSHQQDSGSDSDVQISSPLPLSERLKLKLKNS